MSTIIEGDKLYVVVRKDLKPGEQAAQSLHAIVEFCMAHPHHAKEWHSLSNYVCLLEVSSERRLHKLLKQAEAAKIPHAHFREPWLKDSLTAVALHPSGKDLVKEFQLALRSAPVVQQ
jgi:peptidyl-tRNA hydrolase